MGQVPRTTSSVSSSFAAEPSIDAVTPIGASGEAHATCVVVSKHSCLGSAFQATRMRGGTESAQAGSPDVLIAFAATVIAGWAFGSMPLRSSLLPAMSFVASTAPVAASRTVTVTAASSPGALSASATSCHVAAADRAVAALVAQVDGARLGAGAEAGAGERARPDRR